MSEEIELPLASEATLTQQQLAERATRKDEKRRRKELARVQQQQATSSSSSSSSSAAAPKNRYLDFSRVQYALETCAPMDPMTKKFSVDDGATELMVDYANEFLLSVLEEAAVVALHRNSREIDASDVNFILGIYLSVGFVY